MSLGVVSDEEFTAELERCNKVLHKDIARGRGNKLAVPAVIREIIAEEAIIGESTGREIAERFEVSESSVSAYKHDATSTASYNEPHEVLKKKNNELREVITTRARDTLLTALSHITSDKLANAKARDVAAVAKDMSTIMANVNPTQPGQNIGAQFVFHVPKQRLESDFDVIEVNN